MFTRYFLPILMILLSACAPPGTNTLSYEQPHEYYIRNEKHVSTPPAVVWDKLVKEISKSFFAINNIDKESRIINLSFYTENAEKYIDCGVTHIDTVITIPQRIHKEYKFNNSEDAYLVIGSNYKGFLGRPLPAVIKIVLKTELNGRLNIYVAPSNDGTLATINCLYNLRVVENKETTGYDDFRTYWFNNHTERSGSCTFHTKRSADCAIGDGDNKREYRCTSLGTIEREILSFVE